MSRIALTLAVMVAAACTFILSAPASVTAFAIASYGQPDSGQVIFSVAVDDQNAPSSLVVTTSCEDAFSQPIYAADYPVAGWTEDPGGWVGYAAFTGLPSGEVCHAYAHRANSPHALAELNFTAP